MVQQNITNIMTNINRSVSHISIDGCNSIVSACSGLGVKGELLLERKMYKEIASDVVAATLNKLAGTGASVAGFSEYILGKDKNEIDTIERELSSELKRYNCPQMSVRIEYSDKNSAFCGMAIGLNHLANEEIKSGDIIVGLASSGLHVNGFSKIRELYNSGSLTDDDVLETLKTSYNYYPEVNELFKKGKIKIGVNISKGGIYHCINKILPKGLKADLNLKHIYPQPIFEKLKELTGDEYYNLFNCGIGFCLVAERACDEIFFQDCQKYNPIVLGVIE